MDRNMERMPKLSFAADYLEGAHPKVLQRLLETNMDHEPGYGLDSISESARERLREACVAPNAEVHFLTGGTQTNACVIDVLLAPYQGVIAAESAHIAAHEAGAIEHGGHKVLALPHEDGKLSAEQIDRYCEAWEGDQNHDHMVMPGAVYLSQPTEYGTLYSLDELARISETCARRGLALYVDGARLAYALGCDENDVSLADLARFCDVFYIGGTKCGALLGEAVIIPHAGRLPHFFTLVKQHGALLAKGRVCGAQFDALFSDGLYEELGARAVHAADRIRDALDEFGYELAITSPTNQIFPVLDGATYNRLGRLVDMSFWERAEDGQTITRIATSWATTDEDVRALIDVLDRCRPRREE